MKVDRRPGSGVAKIHIEDDGSYFQVSQVSSSPADLSSDRCSDLAPSTCHQPFFRCALQRALCRGGSSGISLSQVLIV